MMSEEYFLSKQLQRCWTAVYYEPAIQVIHHWHGSLENLPSKQRWNMARDAHREYRKHVGIFVEAVIRHSEYQSTMPRGKLNESYPSLQQLRDGHQRSADRFDERRRLRPLHAPSARRSSRTGIPMNAGAQSCSSMVEQIKAAGKGKDFDCIIGMSGGIDSSYLTYDRHRRTRPAAAGLSRRCRLELAGWRSTTSRSWSTSWAWTSTPRSSTGRRCATCSSPSSSPACRTSTRRRIMPSSPRCTSSPSSTTSSTS